MNEEKKDMLIDRHMELTLELGHSYRNIKDYENEISRIKDENLVKIEELEKIDLELEMIESQEQKHLN